MARFNSGYEDSRKITEENIDTVVNLICKNELLKFQAYTAKDRDDYKKYITEYFLEKLSANDNYQIDALEEFLCKYPSRLCDLRLGDKYRPYNSISYYDKEIGYVRTFDENGEVKPSKGLNVVLGLNPIDVDGNKISGMAIFAEAINDIIKKNPDFENLEGLLILKDVETKKDTAKCDDTFIEENITFEMRVPGKETKEYTLYNDFAEFNRDNSVYDLQKTDYEYRVCKLLNNISKDFIENRTYKIISSQDDSGYDNECLLRLDEDEWVNNRRLLTKDATLYLSHFDEDIREHDKWTDSALGIYDGRLYFSKELECQLDKLIEVIQNQEGEEDIEDSLRSTFGDYLDSAIDIAWGNDEIKLEVQHLLKELGLENDIAIVTRKGKDFEIYPISIIDYYGESPAVVTIADDEKIKAIMKGLDDIKNNYFYEALYNLASEYDIDLEENVLSKAIEQVEKIQEDEKGKKEKTTIRR